MPAVLTHEGAACPRPRRYGRRRAAVLAGVYVLMGLHVAHWKAAGTTLAPLELNEVMYTLELGVVTAGFLFMAAACLSAAIFGRFFCSWGCHILALEDLCAWMLGKAGIHPRPLRSRALVLIAPAAMFYMFIWPQVSRLLAGRPAPQLRALSDADGWASFVTAEFWRNLPGPWIALITFAVCGFAIVYLLGSRSFCAFVCPYGVLFRMADRVAPGRIVLKGRCDQAGRCTAACPSHVRVHEEIARYGSVVDDSCLRCLACVSACPAGALGFGFTRPALERASSRVGRRRLPYDLSLAEEALAAAVVAATLLIFRGLYGVVPFLLTLALGAIFAYAAVQSLRLVRRPHVRLNNFQLKRGGRLTRAGGVFAALSAALAIFVAHSGFIRWHEFHGGRAYVAAVAGKEQLWAGASAELLAGALRHLETVRRFGLYDSPRLLRRLADGHHHQGMLLSVLGREEEAAEEYRAAARLDPRYRAIDPPRGQAGVQGRRP